MPLLIMEGGDSIKDEREILEEVEHFYSDLCSSSGSNQEVLVAREELISYVSTQVTEEKLATLEAKSINKEVRKILKILPKSKASGIDGMIVEVLTFY